MVTECVKCTQKISRGDYLCCFFCAKNYHIDCANVSVKRFLLMNKQNKAKWKCDQCYSKTQTNSSVNVPTNNSFEILTDDDSSDLVTFITQNSRNNSCPDLRKINMEDRIEKLETQNRQLKEKLEIAETELENILLENSKLKQLLSKHEIKNKILSNICSSSSKKNLTTRRKRKSLNGTVLDFLEDEQVECSNYSQQICSTPSRTTATKHQRASGNDTNTPINNSFPDLSLDGSANLETKKNPTIHIIGDQQVRGLAGKLKSLRSGLYNDCYNVTGMVKPFASSSDVLRSCEYVQDSLNSEDILILSAGCNDTNPYLFLTGLCNTLSKLKQCKIFLLSVQHNRFLNVHKLNAEIKLIVKNYKNCIFIDINKLLNSYSDQNMTSTKTKICTKLNIEIDYLKYEHDFIKNGLKIYTNKKSTYQINNCAKMQVTKKGTIPYYFPIKVKTKQTPNKVTQTPENTIPNFFRP